MVTIQTCRISPRTKKSKKLKSHNEKGRGEKSIEGREKRARTPSFRVFSPHKHTPSPPPQIGHPRDVSRFRKPSRPGKRGKRRRISRLNTERRAWMRASRVIFHQSSLEISHTTSCGGATLLGRRNATRGTTRKEWKRERDSAMEEKGRGKFFHRARK